MVLTSLRFTTISSSIIPRSISCTSKEKAQSISWPVLSESLRRCQTNSRGKSESQRLVRRSVVAGKSSITAAPLNEIFGAQGESKDGMVKFTFGRPATMHGTNIGKDMGVNTWAAFARRRRQRRCRWRLRGHRRSTATRFEVTAQRQDQHRGHSSAHDA